MTTWPDNQMLSRPTMKCRLGLHDWEYNEHKDFRRCTNCLKLQLRSGVWRTKHQYNTAHCTVCGNELVGCPNTVVESLSTGVSEVLYTCGCCSTESVFDYGIAPVAIKVDH